MTPKAAGAVVPDDIGKVKWNEWSVDELVEELQYVMERSFKRTIFLIGHRGVGKSQAVYQAAKRAKRNVREDRISHKLPEDIRGVLAASRSKDQAVVLRHPDHEVLFSENGGDWTLFLDEFFHGAPATQSAYYEPVLDHGIGGTPFKKGTVVVGASNREDENANISLPDRPMESRIIWVYVRYDWDAFWKHASGAGQFHPFVLGALKDNPTWTFRPRKDQECEYFGEPLPRTWEFVSDTLKTFADRPESRLKKWIAGSIGPGMAHDFMTWMKTAGQLGPLVDEICQGNDKTAPTLGQQFYVTEVLQSRFRQDRKLTGRLLDYCIAIKKTHGEMGAMLLDSMRKIDWDAIEKSPRKKDVLKHYYSILV